MDIKKISLSIGVTLTIAGFCVSAQQGSGAGPGPRIERNMQFDDNNVSGWSLMSAEERRRYHERMMLSKDFDDCLMLQKDQHTQMQSRAKEKGVNLSSPRQNACERMRERGLFD